MNDLEAAVNMMIDRKAPELGNTLLEIASRNNVKIALTFEVVPGGDGTDITFTAQRVGGVIEITNLPPSEGGFE